MKNILIAFAALIVFGCKTSTKNYPAEISLRQLEEKYDDAKWVLYESGFDRKDYLEKFSYDIIESSNCKKIKVVEMGLKFFSIEEKNDTVRLYFDFVYPETNERCKPRRNLYFTSVGFIKGCPKPVFRAYGDHFGFSPSDSIKSLYKNNPEDFIYEEEKFYKTDMKEYGIYPLKEEEIAFAKYINENKDILHPWLKEEAIERGVLKE